MASPLDISLDSLGVSELQGVELAKAKALMTGYDLKWGEQNNGWRPESVEDIVSFEITGTGWKYAGKVDTIVTDMDTGERVMVEHKTTTVDLTNLSNPYFERLSYEGQLSRYHLAMYLSQRKLDRTCYDVIRKLSIKPKSIPKGAKPTTKGTRAEIKGNSTYYGYEVGDSVDCKNPPSSECLRLYFLRCLHTVTTQTDKYLRRVDYITRTSEQLKDTFSQLTQIVEDIKQADRTKGWYQNTNACNAYNSSCEYLPLCKGISAPEDIYWRERGGGETSGDTTLSHSKASCFMSCRRKFFYRYVMKIEPNRERSHALVFGSAFHVALEEYWKAKLKGDKE